MPRYVGLGDAISDVRIEIADLRMKLRAATNVESKAQIVTSLLNRIGRLMAEYRSLGNEALVAQWQSQYRGLQDAAVQARAELNAGAQPSRVMLALDTIGDRAIQFTTTVVRSVESTVSGVGTTARLLPILLPLALVLAAFVIGGGGLGSVLRTRR